MNKNGHALGALVIGTASISIYVNSFTFPSGETAFIHSSLLASGILVGSFLPDLDADYSYFNYKVPIIPDIYKFVKKLANKKYTLRKFFQHRGIIMHSISGIHICQNHW
jgi:hypothetical protein